MEKTINLLRHELKENADRKQAEILQRFFKTGKGEYGEGDIFLGIKVPLQRKICLPYFDLSFRGIKLLLDSPIHEERFCASAILVRKYEKGDERLKKKVFEFYIKNAKRFNNWDLVDLSASKIVGMYLRDHDRSVLYSLAQSENLWERRIAILSTFTFIKQGDFKDTLKISKILLNDKHDLIHKAVGWMLREVGKMNFSVEEKFIQGNHAIMPRVMLRYALEKFPEDKKRLYMSAKNSKTKKEP